ncbi:MAG: hypothetical protein KIT33_16035 [Candidatus Kapabacteria bacterium]|nr:hypothetical protein [Ignavibacteriota bacterium]MCW5886482.1 hypothetical protein [Candidatus Kapabacteria bacterium]
MITQYEKYRDERLQDPVLKAKYLIAKEKLKLELLLDSVDEAITKQSSLSTIKRRTAKLRKYIEELAV